MVSLTHTDSLAAVAGTFELPGGRPRLAGIGMDCEPLGREPSNAAARRISNPDDKADDLHPISVWTAKEACYKADPSPKKGLAGYALKSFRESVTGGLQAYGERVDFRIWLGEVKRYCLALALAYVSHPLGLVHEPETQGHGRGQ